MMMKPDRRIKNARVAQVKSDSEQKNFDYRTTTHCTESDVNIIRNESFVKNFMVRFFSCFVFHKFGKVKGKSGKVLSTPALQVYYYTANVGLEA